MILEIADFRILPGHEAAFEAALARGLETVMAQARGYRGARFHRGIESPQRYVLAIEWDTLEDHTVGFRQGPLFAQWRALIGPHFAEAPQVEHFEAVPAHGGA